MSLPYPRGLRTVRADVSQYSRRAVAALILSPDPLGGALLGAAVELAGFRLDFAQNGESAGDAVRRVKPRLVMLDCRDERLGDERLLGPAMMMGAWVYLFGTRDGLRNLEVVASRHGAEMLVLPDHSDLLPELLRRAHKHRREHFAK